MMSKKEHIEWEEIISELSECIFRCTPEGRIISASGPFLGRNAAVWQSGTLFQFLPQNVHPEIEDALEIVRQKKTLTQIDLRLPGEKNNTVWYHVYFLCSGHSETILLWMNMSDRSKFDFSSQEERLKIEQILRMRGEVLSVMNHEVRTPLTSIISMTELLENLVTSDDQKECVSILRDAVGRLENLITNLFDTTKSEWSEVEMHYVLFSPLEITRRLLNKNVSRAKSKGIGLECIISDDLPITLRGDEMKIWRICSTLLDNAIKYTDIGKVTVSIDPEYATDKTLMLRIVVKDTGVGIPEEKLAWIFEPFRQNDMSVHRKYSGSGLGLTVVRYLVNVLKGNITLRNNEAGGITATVTLPTDFADVNVR